MKWFFQVKVYVYNVGRGLFDERKAYWHNDESNHAQHPFFPSYLVQISNVYVQIISPLRADDSPLPNTNANDDVISCTLLMVRDDKY